jgi:hypothetical protein
MTTRAELAFKALDKDNSGYITGILLMNIHFKFFLLYPISAELHFFQPILMKLSENVPFG